MVDFLKVEDLPEKDYAYVCDRCGEEIVFVVEMPEHLRRHVGGSSCGGRLSFVRVEDRAPMTSRHALRGGGT
jgi:predicted nucleic acid-binding Zn ribbon protein